MIFFLVSSFMYLPWGRWLLLDTQFHPHPLPALDFDITPFVNHWSINSMAEICRYLRANSGSCACFLCILVPWPLRKSFSFPLPQTFAGKDILYLNMARLNMLLQEEFL